VLSKLAYQTLCRTIQLLVLLVGDAAEDLEILVLRHQPAVLRRHSASPPVPARSARPSVGRSEMERNPGRSSSGRSSPFWHP
jgi:hypothetical protein